MEFCLSAGSFSLPAWVQFPVDCVDLLGAFSFSTDAFSPRFEVSISQSRIILRHC